MDGSVYAQHPGLAFRYLASVASLANGFPAVGQLQPLCGVNALESDAAVLFSAQVYLRQSL